MTGDPCHSCPRITGRCLQHTKCLHWRAHYFARQALINGYASKVYAKPAIDADALRLYGAERYHDYLRRGPCQGCPAEEHCDIPCAAYLQWWDERMEWFRRTIHD